MKVLNETQLSKIQLKAKGNRKIETSPVYKAYMLMNQLEVGQGLLVKNEEWKLKNYPSNKSLPESLRTDKRKYSTNALSDNSGFVVTRIA